MQKVYQQHQCAIILDNDFIAGDIYCNGLVTRSLRTHTTESETIKFNSQLQSTPDCTYYCHCQTQRQSLKGVYVVLKTDPHGKQPL